MNQLFRPAANTIARLSLLASLLAGVVILALLLVNDQSPYTRASVGIAIEQPVRFSHKLHSDQLNIECLYCHATAEQSSYGGIPDTHTCMSCHSQIATYSTLLEPVRTSYATGERLVWEKVHDLAEHVYFNHSIHVQAGFACETCHGRVDQMVVAWQAQNMTMDWCLECHWEPEEYIRPVEEVYTFGYEAPEDQVELGMQLVAFHEIDVDRLDSCSICHR
ncbi:MAG: cytochrome c3 family protein [Anaerolineae bacterium]|nr:cytochrome c3 family protein [Anaerolineae bacterium]